MILRAKPSVAGSTGLLAPEVPRLPAQHVAEQDRGLVVEVVPGRDDVVPVLERDGVEQVPLREPARSRTAIGACRRGRRGHREAEVGPPGRPRGAGGPGGRRTRGRSRSTCPSTRRCRGRGRDRRPRSRGRASRSHSASESLPPDTATRTRSVGLRSSGGRGSRAGPAPGSARRSARSQNAALWRRTSMTAGPRHTRHFTPHRPTSPVGSRRRTRR